MFLKLKQKHDSFLAKLRQINWTGMVLFLASTTGLLIPVTTWGGVQYPWDSFHTLVPLIASALGLGGVYCASRILRRPAAQPLIHTAIFKDKTAAILSVSDVIHGIAL